MPNAFTAEVFNKHFLSLAEILTRTLRKEGGEYQCTDRLRNFCINRFKSHGTISMLEIIAHEVGKHISGVGSKNTSGCDGISNRIILFSLPYVVQHLTYVYNLCIKLNSFPSNLKAAKITPVPKAKDLTNISNYLPISVYLPFQSPRRSACT